MPRTARDHQPRWAAGRASRLLTAAACAMPLGIVGFVSVRGGDGDNDAARSRVSLRQRARSLTTSTRQPSMLVVPAAMPPPTS